MECDKYKIRKDQIRIFKSFHSHNNEYKISMNIKYQ